jgi:hypothetical protein
MKKNVRTLIASVGLLGTVVVGGASIANAQTNTATTAVKASPTAASTTASTVRPDHTTQLNSALAPLVTAGTITQAQADAVVKAIEAARPTDGGPGRHGGGMGRGGMGGMGDGGKGRGLGGPMSNHGDVIAKALGITTAELQTAMQSGKTIAQVAAAKGVSVQKVIDAFVADEKEEHPDMAAADITARVTDMVNGVRPTRPASAPTSGSAATTPSTKAVSA